jgi:hypothetical protein
MLCKLSTDQQAAVALSNASEQEVQDRLTVLLDQICEQVEIKEDDGGGYASPAKPSQKSSAKPPAKIDFTTSAFSPQDLGTSTAFPQQVVPTGGVSVGGGFPTQQLSSGFPSQQLPPGLPAGLPQTSLPPGLPPGLPTGFPPQQLPQQGGGGGPPPGF